LDKVVLVSNKQIMLAQNFLPLPEPLCLRCRFGVRMHSGEREISKNKAYLVSILLLQSRDEGMSHAEMEDIHVAYSPERAWGVGERTG